MKEKILEEFKIDFCAENALLNLKSLNLTFSSCKNMTEEGVEFLRTALKESKPHIENIDIIFLDYSADSSWEPEEEDSDDESYDPNEDENYDDSDDSDENGDDYILKE